MERNDLIRDNGSIFVEQGRALNKYARDCVKVCVVGNPANTNCLILANNAPDIPIRNFTAMTRLDHDRGLAQIAKKAKCSVEDISQFCMFCVSLFFLFFYFFIFLFFYFFFYFFFFSSWGNHSSTMFPDLTNASINGKPALDLLRDVNSGENIEDWYTNELIPTVQQRGSAIIAARGLSSAASAANACLQHTRNWELGTDGEWTSMSIPSNGEYGITPGLFFSYPVTCDDTNYTLAEGLSEFNAFQESKIRETERELLSERDTVADMLPN